jgi:hypothetical protein
MAFVAGLIGPVFKLGVGIASQVNQGKEDQNFRNGWTQQQLGVVTAAHQGKNVMIVYPKHDASKLVNSQQSQLQCVCPSSGTTLSYDCYVFDSGPFTLQGDG